jgi:hypothetical protein
MHSQANLEFEFARKPARPGPPLQAPLPEQLRVFEEFGKRSREYETAAFSFSGKPLAVPTYINEFWTSKQRAASSLHEVSYRACFKPQLPRFFIERLTNPGDVVFDPFMGRGTTLIEAALLGRIPAGCDVNPLSTVLIRPRLHPPTLDQIARRLKEINYAYPDKTPEDLLVFYHPETLKQLCALRAYLLNRTCANKADSIDDWIRMVAVNRLTGHSPGFFSVYTLPPNQAVSVKSQRRINERRKQTPPVRDVAAIILKKSRQLLADCDAGARRVIERIAPHAQLVTGHSAQVPAVPSESVSLIVTSPPFLNVVDYAGDNWLRCWFIGIDATSVKLTVPRELDEWQKAMTEVFRELHRLLKPGGHVAFEVGEILGGTVKLEEAVVPCGKEAGLEPVLILINSQTFTKTANCWGVDNNDKGTNTNRIVVFRKPA